MVLISPVEGPYGLTVSEGSSRSDPCSGERHGVLRTNGCQACLQPPSAGVLLACSCLRTFAHAASSLRKALPTNLCMIKFLPDSPPCVLLSLSVCMVYPACHHIKLPYLHGHLRVYGVCFPTTTSAPVRDAVRTQLRLPVPRAGPVAQRKALRKCLWSA